MNKGTGFVPDRLREALDRQRKTAVWLAGEIGVSEQTISRFLSGQSPRADQLRLIASALGEPLAFFLRQVGTSGRDTSPSFMRSYAAATKRARASANALKDRTREVSIYVDQYVELPDVRFPHFPLGDDPSAISWRDVEAAADQTRRHWGLGDRPIANVTKLIEHNGGIVVRLALGDETLDAFSQWGMPEDRPYFILSDEKKSAVRSRFDAAHELGHMVLHRNLPPEVVSNPVFHPVLEKQAHRFAAAFLMPESSFRNSVFLPTLSALRELKPVWGVAIAAMIMRLYELQLITERQRKRLFEQYAPWRRHEPLDDELPAEAPQTLREALEIIKTECGISPEQVLADLSFNEDDVAAIGALPIGFFRDSGPRLRMKRTQPTTVLPFRSQTEAS